MQRARGEQVWSLAQGSDELQAWTHCSRSQYWPAGQSALMTHAGWPLTGGGGLLVVVVGAADADGAVEEPVGDDEHPAPTIAVSTCASWTIR